MKKKILDLENLHPYRFWDADFDVLSPRGWNQNFVIDGRAPIYARKVPPAPHITPTWQTGVGGMA